MTNAEKYPTADERAKAFEEFCSSEHCLTCFLYRKNREFTVDVCMAFWLDLEAEEEKPLPCPFCGGATKVIGTVSFHVTCTDCMYESDMGPDKVSIVAAHNRVARAVMEAGKKEEK